MSSGGARNRSGPQPDPNSGRSDRRNLTFTALPPTGYDGDAPDFPLPQPNTREQQLWEWAWTTPQACVWAVESWRWMTVAQWVRWTVKAEDAYNDVPAATLTATIRLADQIGLTPAGLRENGWAIAEVKPVAAAEENPAASVTDIRTRLAGS